MDAIALGPVLVPLPRLYTLAVTLLLLALSVFLLGLPRQRHVRWFNGLIIVWLVAAHLGHVALNLEAYAQAPWDIIKLWLPGFHGVIGLLAGLAWTLWALRDRLAALLGASGLILGTALLWLALMAWAPLGGGLALRQLPALSLENLQGETVELAAIRNEHVVVNLWATWCPPCRREMPLLQEADQREDVSVVVVNQGEDLMPVVRYLDEQGLAFEHALLDPRQSLMVQSDAQGLPMTLLFDDQGRAVTQHVGELTPAILNRWLADD
ncbi:TlpA family protein disulfide reductase [Halomonas sp. 18H]|uniref:TlpA disulfide reductase family protein n=1 Tax=Halomonas almeriensis TaxID=308163 RepID=UPI002231E312|nr:MULTISPECIES: TlpA disulfide reductase family protein [Halomonas]MCW4149798.1 TlpA family protein disulfide reductase [Halomonas sp. 18H]MDN3553241.1 TlpA disulfide reductase family protein [Halomonas almeriensis]